jgi:hypothetical protein
MLRKLGMFIWAILLFFVMVPEASAHPGRTDANGGHTCKTNCASWGLGDGEYHSHGSGTSSDAAPVQESVQVQQVVAIPTSASYPTRVPTTIPTRIPIRLPTQTPVPTIRATATPTFTTAPTAKSAIKGQPVQATVKAQKQQGLFDWLLSLFSGK